MGRCAGLTCHDAHGAKEVRREAAVMEGVLPVDYKCELATGFMGFRVSDHATLRVAPRRSGAWTSISCP